MCVCVFDLKRFHFEFALQITIRVKWSQKIPRNYPFCFHLLPDTFLVEKEQYYFVPLRFIFISHSLHSLQGLVPIPPSH